MRRSQSCVLEPSGSMSISSSRRIGDQRLDRAPVGQADRVGRRHDDQARHSAAGGRPRRSGAPARTARRRPTGRGRCPAGRSCRRACRRCGPPRTAPARRRARTRACPFPGLPTNMTSASRWPARWARSRGDAALDPVEVAHARLGAQVAQLVVDRRGDDAAARDVVVVDDHEAPGRLAVGGQVERERLLQSPGPRPRRRAGRCGPSRAGLPTRDGVDDLVDLVDAHRHRRGAELQLVVAPGDERLLAQPDDVGPQPRRPAAACSTWLITSPRVT